MSWNGKIFIETKPLKKAGKYELPPPAPSAISPRSLPKFANSSPPTFPVNPPSKPSPSNSTPPSISAISTKASNSSAASPLEALLKDLPGENKLELTESHHLIEIEPTASAMSSAEVHGAETAHGNAVNSASPKPRLPSRSSPPPRPPTTDWYLPHTNPPIARADAAQVQGHYKNLVEAKEAFCELKSHLQIRPVFHSKPEGSSTMVWPSTIIKGDFAKIICGIWRYFFAL